MALTERSRAALFRGLSDVLDDEEAVGELLSYFPARDADEPASRDFVDARIAHVEARVIALEARMDSGFSAMEARMDSGLSAMEARMDSGLSVTNARMGAGLAELRGEMVAAMHAEIRTMTQWTVGSIVAIVGLLVALGLIR